MTWQVDKSHSRVEFSAKHMLITTVKGHFDDYSAEVFIDEADLTKSSVKGFIQVASLTTGNEQRDGHLRSDDFFNAEKYPQITFKSTSIKKLSAEEYELTGDLTIRDITKPVTLQATFGGKVVDPYGNERIGGSLEGSIRRKEFGLNWDGLLENGSAVVGDKIKLSLDIEIMRPVAASTKS